MIHGYVVADNLPSNIAGQNLLGAKESARKGTGTECNARGRGQIANTQSDQLTDIPATKSVECEDFQLSFQLRLGNGTEAGNVWRWENPNNNNPER